MSKHAVVTPIPDVPPVRVLTDELRDLIDVQMERLHDCAAIATMLESVGRAHEDAVAGESSTEAFGEIWDGIRASGKRLASDLEDINAQLEKVWKGGR